MLFVTLCVVWLIKMQLVVDDYHVFNFHIVDSGAIQLFKKLDIGFLEIGDYLGTLLHSFIWINICNFTWNFIFSICMGAFKKTFITSIIMIIYNA